MQWILRTRLVYIGKKDSTKPRPLRVGEVLRRMVAKYLLARHQSAIVKRMLRCRQFGVSLPGGTECLIHWRETVIAEISSDPSNGVWALLDLDFQNCYPSLEWDDIEDATDKHAPELSRWVRWCHGVRETPPSQDGAGSGTISNPLSTDRCAGAVILPGGGIHLPDRGAEQGDPHGSAQCGLVLSDVSDEMNRSLAASAPAAPFLDVWYADDSQAICRPSVVDSLLSALDAAARQRGVVRGRGSDCKSHVRLVGHPDALRVFAESDDGRTWVSDTVSDSCCVDAPNSAFECLGTVVGDSAARRAQFLECTEKLGNTHELISNLMDPAVELTLGRVSVNVSRVVHLLRTAGSDLSDDVCAAFDTAQANFLERVLAGDLRKSAHDQACLGVRSGGLGLRRATSMRLAASIASRVEARPFVEALFAEMDKRGFHLPGCAQRFNNCIQADLAAFVAQLPADDAEKVQAAVAKAKARASARYEALCSGHRPEQSGPPVGSQSAGARIVTNFGAEDLEHPDAQAGPPRLQRALLAFVDCAASAQLFDEAAEVDKTRLRDLADPATDHEYLWLLADPPTGGLPADAYIIDVRARLGAQQADDSRLCGCCQRVRMDPECSHAQCCAPGPSTAGHNDVRDAVFDLVRIADSTAETEALGLLCTAPHLRPADILTSAVPGSQLHALDVSVAAPLAQRAGEDCCASAARRKMTYYRPWFDELTRSGIRYVPLVWSWWGRPSADAAAMLLTIARRAARRRGLASPAALLRRAHCGIGLALAKRRAAMIAACLA